MRYVNAHEASDVIPLIREALKDSGKTQKMMADHLGFSTKHMSGVLTGKSGTPLPVVFRMLEYLDITMVLTPSP